MSETIENILKRYAETFAGMTEAEQVLVKDVAAQSELDYRTMDPAEALAHATRKPPEQANPNPPYTIDFDRVPAQLLAMELQRVAANSNVDWRFLHRDAILNQRLDKLVYVRDYAELVEDGGDGD